MKIKIEDLEKRYPGYKVEIQEEGICILKVANNGGWRLGNLVDGEVDVLEIVLERCDTYHKEDLAGGFICVKKT